ncbi:2',3'-cyclic-nucleotide 3'-phosphodiesterase-like [Sycon ciliatum]|uniref:2',3'-cyclic-nucleotide 3'-phosphodiesterase-like n=1 Tax=Sycon ciliatum TaxID=27933 RepID=UPI0020A937FD|eukprot:scpid70489/ scgid20150/ NEDD4-binding protein 2-like 1
MPWSGHFAFVQSARSQALLRRSRAIFLMRGLPGSGKSRIIKDHISRLLPSATICSADDFMMQDGKYCFQKTKLKDAHADCFKHSMAAAARRVPALCIDNQHTAAWTTHRVLLLARAYQYMVFVLESRTPWRRDPAALAEKCIHGVGEEHVELALKAYEPMLAEYYGWFLPQAESAYLNRVARHYFSLSLSRSYSFSNWYNLLLSSTKAVDSFTKLASIDPSRHYASVDTVLFANATPFLNAANNGGGEEEVEQDLRRRVCYSTSRKVCSHLTSSAPLRVFSVYFTPRSCGARVFVPEQVVDLCEAADEHEDRDVGVECSADSPALADAEVAAMQDGPVTWAEREQFCPFYSTSEPGALVHVRLGQQDGLAQRQCIDDLTTIVQDEIDRAAQAATGHDNCDVVNLGDATVREYGDAWVVYFNKPIEIQGLFTGSYNSSKLSAT